jgi:hypothetical protein
VGFEGVDPAVETAWGGEVGEEGKVLGEGQGPSVVAAEVEGGEDGEGEDGAGGGFGLRVVFVAQEGEEVVYNAEGRYGFAKHSGLHFCIPAKEVGGNLGKDSL